jgi:hypothetical protein
MPVAFLDFWISSRFHRAVTDYFQKTYASMAGSCRWCSPPAASRWPGRPRHRSRQGREPQPWPPSARSWQQRRFAEARPLLDTLLQLQPEHPEALYNLGMLASEEGKLEEARLLLRRAVVANVGMPMPRPMPRWPWP